MFVLAKTNISARLGSSSLGLQSELYNFHAIYKEVKTEAFSITSACVPTKGVIWYMANYIENQSAKISKCNNDGQWLVYCFIIQVCQIQILYSYKSYDDICKFEKVEN